MNAEEWRRPTYQAVQRFRFARYTRGRPANQERSMLMPPSHSLVSKITYSDIADLEFAEEIVSAIATTAGPDYTNTRLRLQGFLPPFDGIPPAGYLEVWLEKEGLPPLAFGICLDPESDRTGLDKSFSPVNCYGAIDANINLQTFDELWYVLSRLANELKAESVELLYGC